MAQPQWQVISDLIAFVFNAELECVTQLALCGCRDLCSEQSNINMAYRIQLEPSRGQEFVRTASDDSLKGKRSFPHWQSKVLTRMAAQEKSAVSRTNVVKKLLNTSMSLFMHVQLEICCKKRQLDKPHRMISWFAEVRIRTENYATS